ncbi:tautomerase [Erwinia sp. E602]|uniref:tautomerase family protein n=1 Tax=unclassified Erwinia TaxID=2622719 RepID=UPI0006F78EA8|nr:MULTISPECIES: tautomerase family protein [unclassified Erwinia]KQN57772.1 tautomerase [Erwinia sp. Leaf53]PLV55445.1 tautomerase [Erwinia sp. B116]QUG77481.1 tautomerase [Erwinia sp. E602]
MPFVQITTWKMSDESQVKAMVEAVTLAVHTTSGAPLDKISVVISEVEPSRWCDAGVLGSDPEFPVKSRRKGYGE